MAAEVRQDIGGVWPLAAVDSYIDRDVLARQIAREEQQRRALSEFLGK